MIDDRTAYGQGVAEEFAKAAKAAGGNVAAREYTTDKATDFNAILTSIKAKEARRRSLRRHGRRCWPDAAPDEGIGHQRQSSWAATAFAPPSCQARW